jgi:hypothetical protein
MDFHVHVSPQIAFQALILIVAVTVSAWRRK